MDLKQKGYVKFIGVGAKNWRSVELIEEDVALDWVMIANSLTLFDHSKELLNFVEHLRRKGITIINSAIFHGGFLMGSDFFNYEELSKANPAHKILLLARQISYYLQ